MIHFQPLDLHFRDEYSRILAEIPPRGCEYSFANLYLWGLQKVAESAGCLLFFSHAHGKSVYPYPVGTGDKQAAVRLLIEDAEERGIPCRFVCLSNADKEELESLFPGEFLFRPDRDGFDYVYDINDLANLKGRKYQKKRNHIHKFQENHPNATVQVLTGDLLEQSQHFCANWFRSRKLEDPHGNYLLEEIAIARAYRHYDALGLRGIALVEDGKILAVSIGSPLSREIYDIHFEKADDRDDGAYAAVNQAFAGFLRAQYPALKFLNREDDMGLEGLRKAKLSYCPTYMEEKYWAYALCDAIGEAADGFSIS